MSGSNVQAHLTACPESLELERPCLYDARIEVAFFTASLVRVDVAGDAGFLLSAVGEWERDDDQPATSNITSYVPAPVPWSGRYDT